MTMPRCDRRLSVADRAPRRARVFAVAGMIVLLSGCDFWISADRHVARAEAHTDGANYRAAMAELKAVVEKKPDHVAARLALARLYWKLGESEAAQTQIDYAQKIGATDAQSRELASRILLQQGHYPDVVSLLQTDRALPEATRRTLLAEANIGLQQWTEAENNLAAATAASPGSIEPQLQEARLEEAQGQLESAASTLQRAVASSPTSTEAWMLLGQLYGVQQNYHESALAFERGRTAGLNQLTQPEVLFLLVGEMESQLRDGDLSAAGATQSRLEAHFGPLLVTRYFSSRLAFSRGDYQAAASEARRALQISADYQPAHLVLAAALLGQGSLEQAQQELSEFVAKHPDSAAGRSLLARLYMVRQQPDKAREVLVGASGQKQVDPRLDWLMGAALMQSGQQDAGLSYLEKSFAERKNDLSARLDLARAYIAADYGEKALELLQEITPQARSATTQALFAAASITGKQPAEARQALDQLLSASPQNAVLLEISGRFALRSGDRARAEHDLRASIALEPQAAPARMDLARLEVQNSDRDAAEKELRDLVKLQPRYQPAYLALAELAMQRDDRTQARQVLEGAVAADPKSVEARLGLAQLALMANDQNRAQIFLDQALAVSANRGKVLEAEGRQLFNNGRVDAALARFQEAVDTGERRAALDLARAQFSLGRIDAARNTLDALLSTSPTPDLARAASLLLVRMDASAGRYDQALKRLAELRRTGVDTTVADELQGDVEVAAHHMDSAAKLYDKALNQKPSADLVLKSFHARRDSNTTEPQSVLLKWLHDNPGDVRVRFALASYQQRLGQRTEAVSQYERLIATPAGRSPAALNNLACLYSDSDDGRALALARAAHDAAPNAANISDTYGWILVKGGRITQGLPLLEQAAAKLPMNPDVQYHLAAARAQSGDKAGATAIIATLLKSQDKFDARPDAAKLLQTLSGK
jgi:putative PEP-CTERM system TPR-repeat lipoprotein